MDSAGVPVLDLGQYVLRPLRHEDGPDWLRIVTDPSVRRDTSWNVDTLATVSGMIERNIQGYADNSRRRWAIVGRGDDALVGTCGFLSWDDRAAKAEIAYELAPEHWGQGLMTRAVQAVLRHGFGVMGLNRIEGLVMVDNARSIRVLEKQGFLREGRMREFRRCGEHLRDFYFFALLQREWRERAQDSGV